MVMKSLDISFLHKLVKICREQPLFQLIKKRFGVLIHAVDLYLGTSATKPQKIRISPPQKKKYIYIYINRLHL